MRRAFLLALSLACVSFHTPARAAGGSEGGGGGNELIAEFVATANLLLDQVSFTPGHRALLKKALAKARIRSVRRLVHPVTGEELPHQEKLIAWGSLGEIQLKERFYMGEASFEDAVKNTGPIAHIVIHELFRASGAQDDSGKSIDENFQLSIGKYRLDHNPTRALSRPRRSVQTLYAECRITDCKLTGNWSEGDEELICRPENEALNGYLGATLQVFKVENPRGYELYDGTLSIVRNKTLERRLGTQELFNVRLAEGEEFVQIIDDNTNSLQNFLIPYSTRSSPVTEGFLRVNHSTLGRAHFVDLTLGGCRTKIQ